MLKNRALERSWGCLWEVLGSLGTSWVCPGRTWSASETTIGCLGDVLGLSWNVLGGSWGVIGKPWKLPGTILKAFLKDFLVS